MSKSYRTTFLIVILAFLMLFISCEQQSNSTLYTVTFVSQDADSGEAPKAVEVAEGKSLVLSSGTLTKAGYDLSWNTKADGTGDSYAVSSSITVVNDITLYSKWTLHTYSIHMM